MQKCNRKSIIIKIVVEEAQKRTFNKIITKCK